MIDGGKEIDAYDDGSKGHVGVEPGGHGRQERGEREELFSG
jgi:hypothetical protein